MRHRQSLTALAQACVAAHIRPGDLAIDATVGNGRDLVFLAKQVGPTGAVIGFDIQAEALCAAHAALPHALRDRVRLVHVDHRTLAEHSTRQARCVMFNLGYRPGGDHRIITRIDSTLEALAAAQGILAPEGCISVLAYTGHPGGSEEAAAVAAWCETLPASFSATLANPEPPGPVTPRLYLIRRDPLP